jgi:recombination protein RecA
MSKYPDKSWKDKIMQSWTPEFVISSGSLCLDHSEALKNYKGIPAGTMVQISSDQEGAFKSSLALAGGRNIQKETDKKIVYVDAECGLTGLKWIEDMGIMTDEDHWLYAQPESGEEACAMIDYFLKQEDVGGVIADSVDAMVPQNQLTSEHGDASIGAHAKLITRAVRKWKGLVRNHQSILWLVNQKKVNLTHMGAMGTKSTGGRAINFYCKLNIDMRKNKSENQLEGEEYIPLTMNIRRSKLGRSYIDVPTYAKQGVGIDNDIELVELAERNNIIGKAGSWYKVVDQETGELTDTIGQGANSAKEWCINHKEEIMEAL